MSDSPAPSPADPFAAITVAEPAPGANAEAAASTAPVLAAEAPTFAGSRSRSRTVVLDWPLFWQGRLYDTIVVQRPTTRQVADFYDRLAALPEVDGARGLRFPLFYTPDGTAVPDAVMDGLDPDDADALQGDILDFLPLRLQALRGSASSPGDGEATAPTSNE